MPRILVVDDSRVTRRVVRGSPLQAGLQNGQFVEDVDGLGVPAQVYEFESFDLVSCDLCMPNMDGAELLDAFAEREVLDCFPVVIVTGDDDQGKAAEALAQGDRKLIPEPFSPELLKETPTELLGASSTKP